jgi:UDP-N-acetylglucosamine--N-acetylmuramyl-(pentapeptide) pyrophosphoryl-undecaprenol N-acetylglucosamine transferase
VVIGTGGYASAPVVLAARILGVPILLIEPNSIPGRTTTMLARFADEVALGLQESVRHFSRGTNLRVTGVPIRPSMLSCTREEGLQVFGLSPGRKTVFVFGGSRGASSINRALVDAARTLQDRQDLQFLVQTGRGDYQMVAGALSGLRIPCVVHPYIDDIGHAYAVCDLAVCRAGAGTIAELTAFGLPSILIPYPHATGGHQETNARILEESGAASVILDEDLNGRNLANTIVAIIDDAGHLGDMSRNSRGLGNPDAPREIAVRLVELAGHKGRLSRLAAVLVELCSVR